MDFEKWFKEQYPSRSNAKPNERVFSKTDLWIAFQAGPQSRLSVEEVLSVLKHLQQKVKPMMKFTICNTEVWEIDEVLSGDLYAEGSTIPELIEAIDRLKGGE